MKTGIDWILVCYILDANAVTTGTSYAVAYTGTATIEGQITGLDPST